MARAEPESWRARHACQSAAGQQRRPAETASGGAASSTDTSSWWAPAAAASASRAGPCCEARDQPPQARAQAQAQDPQGQQPSPWLPACSRWAVTPSGHLPADIEDLHEAACGGGGGSSGTYDDPQTGFMVFTAAALAKRKSCCANRCRHCPFGHYKVQGPRPRVNRLTQPALLQPSPGTRRAAAASAVRGSATGSGSGSGAGAEAEVGATLVVYEGDAASEALARMMAAAVAAAPSAASASARGVGCLPQSSAPFQAGQRLALLAAFDVDTGRLWGPAGDPSTAPAAAALRAGSDADADGGGGGDIGAAMDASLRHNLDLVAVPLQVSGRSWQRDPSAAGEALAHVLATAARLMQAGHVERVVVSRPEDGTPALFAAGTRGCVAGGWEALLQLANAQLRQQQ
ncbi:hypothetical protein HXX76_004920 [Chlamydomonas incerta]|uniref:Uncharacterized protein n=1 Tax=Chlamydomonas incerta TaxID=51695 RepID=A0A835T611_CHLIN|nr:hypothetical protein HXX76_004920 [Chlamydomonas incerta]|eukprot:KAG2439567.1 hypothetical protein HXX76_004920 [Chlamydomonas incerta]